MTKPSLGKYLVIGLLLLGSYPAAAATVSWGALATSVVADCDGAGNCNIDTAEDADGGSTSASASSSITDPRGNSTASATLSGISLTPTLSVFADSLSDPTSDPDLVQSSASGIQAYTSTENRTITLDILLTTGEVSGPLLSTNAVVANVVVFKPGAPELTFDGDTLEEIALDPILASAHRSAGLFATPFSSIPSASLEFDVVAGESFLIWALLLAQSEDGGVADASSTLSMQLFDTGSELDENDLIIASKNVGVVPLPAGVWLFLSGIGLIVGLGSRRKAAVTG